MNPWEKYQSSDVTTQDGPWSKYAASSSGQRPSIAQDASFGDQFGELSKLANTSVKKTFGGTSFTEDATARSLAGQDVPASTSRPFDANLGDVQDTAFKNNVIAQGKDAITSPSVLIPGAINKLSPVIKPAVKAVSEGVDAVRNNISRMALNPEFRSTSSTLKYGQDAKRVMQNMPDVVGPDVHSTLDAVNNKTEEIGKAIGDTIDNHPNANVKLNAAPSVLKPFSDKISELNKIDPKGNSALIKRLKNAQQSLIKITDEDGQVIGTHDLQNMTPRELFNYRQEKIDPRTRYTGNPSDDADLNEVFQKVKSNVRNLQNKNMPELKSLNQDYGDLHAAGDAMQKLVNKADNEGLPKLDFEKISKIGFIPWIGNPVNRINLARWLYTAPKSQIQQAAQNIPGFTQGVRQSYGGFKNASLVTTPKGVSGPSSKVGLSQIKSVGLPEGSSPTARNGANAETSMGGLPNPNTVPIPQGGAVPKGLPEPFQGRSGVDRPWENQALPSPRVAGQSSGPVIKQRGYTPPGQPVTPASVDIPPKYGTDEANLLYGQMKAKENIPIHPIEEGTAFKDTIYSKNSPEVLARNMGIKPDQVDSLADIKGMLENSEKGTNQGTSYSGGKQGERYNWKVKSNVPEFLKGKYTTTQLSKMLEDKLNGGKVNSGQSLIIKRLLKHYFPKS